MSTAQADITRARLDEFLDAITQDLVQLASLHDEELGLERLEALKAVEFPSNLGMCLWSERGHEAARLMQTALDDLRGDSSDRVMDHLAADYADIYLNHTLRASPYESVWLDEDHLMRQVPMFEVRKWYEKNGMKAVNWQQKPDDFLSLQLHFIALLLDPERRVSSDSVDIAKRIRDAGKFMDSHLLRWLPDFATRVVSRCSTTFYAALAALTDVYVDELREHIASILDEPRPTPAAVEEKSPNRQVEDESFVPGVAPSW